MTFGQLIVTDTFKLINEVSGKVSPNCPEYTKITPIRFSKNTVVNACYQSMSKKPASYVFITNDTPVVKITFQ